MGKSKRELASLKKKVHPYNPVQIKEGEVLTDITARKWRIGKPVGAGGFGEIYLASDEISKPVPQDAIYAAKIEPHKSGPLFVERNFYVRVAKKELIDEWKKNKGLKHLGMPYFISFGSHIYQNEKYRFLIVQRFGQDLGKVLAKSKKRFHIKTVLTLGIQILDILEYIHSHGYIHADIKDSNLLLGYEKDDENVYLLDYGLACRYIDSLGSHKEFHPDQRKAHDGTLQYTSRDAHIGAHSRRSDLEVLAYNMIHWLSGSLPWKDELSDPERVAQEKESYMNNIPVFLRKCFGENPPVVLSHFLKYVVSLSFETEPDYEYCKTLLRQGIRQAGYADDGKLNLNSTPAKLKTRKRIRNVDIENWVQLKPVKMPRNSSRQPCVPVQTNFNRMTRQQTAANSPALRSRETFDWIKVLQSNPEKILKTQSSTNDQVKKRRTRNQFKEKPKSIQINLKKKEKENPLENPTPAILEVLKCRNSSVPQNVGKRSRSESHCCSPVFYDNTTLTPAMEEVIRRRETRNYREEDEEEFDPASQSSSRSSSSSYSSRSYSSSCPALPPSPPPLPPSTGTISTRSNRFRKRSETSLVTKVESVDVKRVTRKTTSFLEAKAQKVGALRKRTRKHSLEERNKLAVETAATTPMKKKNDRGAGKTKSAKTKNIRRGRKGPPTLPKSPNKKVLGFSRRKKIRRREVSPSEIDFVPRLRSGGDNPEDFAAEKMWNAAVFGQSNPKIRNYAANSGRKRNCGLSSSSRDSSIIVQR